MTKEEIRQNLTTYQLPKWDKLPDFDIYMDQVIYFINNGLAPLYFNDDKIITNSMVNNYVKSSIVKPPVKKHYTQNHLAYLIVVCILKRCYSLTEISNLLKIYQNESKASVGDAYNEFVALFEDYLHEIMKHDKITQQIEGVTSYQRLMDNVIKSIVYKIYAEIETLELI
ncbi:MAG: DUF1836 domain-containing protein [Firmicutes bacterium]|nr:DUF1836 domain-containing protein [Bacillota bacterium]